MLEYTVIPDVHADLRRLEASLAMAGQGGKIAFLGDFIDAGAGVDAPDDATVLGRVRQACEDGAAIAVMGNHELNAILFHRVGGQGSPLRARDAKNLRQHRSFCDQFGIGTVAARDWTSWFLRLPLWLDLGGLRLVHAYWSESAIATISARRPDGRLHEADLEEVSAKKTDFAKAVELLVSGPEIALPGGVTFRDAGGHVRSDVRVAWWRADAPTWRDASLSVPNPSELPVGEIGSAMDVEFYEPGEPPVLVGHYKMAGTPRIEAGQAACLDYPKRPCLYRWSGEATLRQDRLIEVRA